MHAFAWSYRMRETSLFCHSERSEESLFRFKRLRPGEILRFAQNDKIGSANLEARGGIEPPIKVLQTFALPLGDRASEATRFYQKFPRSVFPRIVPIKNKSRRATFRPPRSCRTEFPGWMSSQLELEL